MPVSKRKKDEPTAPITRPVTEQGGGGAISTSSFSPAANVPSDYVAYDSNEAMMQERERIKNAIDQMKRFNKLAPTVIGFYEELTTVWNNILGIKKAYMRSEVARNRAMQQLEVLGKQFDTLVEQITGRKEKAMNEIDRRHAEFQSRLNGGRQEQQPFAPQQRHRA